MTCCNRLIDRSCVYGERCCLFFTLLRSCTNLSPLALCVYLQIDPRKLPSGVHTAEVVATQPESQPGTDVGPVFRIPVTVVKGEPPNVNSYTSTYENLRLAPGEMVRQFISVPLGATWAELELKADGFETTKVGWWRRLPRKRRRVYIYVH